MVVINYVCTYSPIRYFLLPRRTYPEGIFSRQKEWWMKDYHSDTLPSHQQRGEQPLMCLCVCVCTLCVCIIMCMHV